MTKIRADNLREIIASAQAKRAAKLQEEPKSPLPKGLPSQTAVVFGALQAISMRRLLLR